VGKVVVRTRGYLDIRLLGHLEVAVEGEPFRFATPRKSLQVLAYLLLHRAAPVSREYLAFLLYPDDEEGTARAKLRATLKDMQRSLPQPADRYVYVDAEKLAWNSHADVWLDVDAFTAASNDRSRLGEAIDLYRGEFLEGLQSLPLQLIHPPLQVVEHGPFVVVVPQPLQAFFQQVGFEDPSVQSEQPV